MPAAVAARWGRARASLARIVKTSLALVMSFFSRGA
jgi:hypothetical protein